MKIRIIMLLSALLGALSVFADAETDKLMSKIIRDTRTYLSAEARGASEDAAYEQALSELSGKVTDYFKSENMALPDAVYLAKLSSHSERLISQSGSNRCRVVVYINKKDLHPMGDTSGAVVLAKNNNESYSIVNPGNGADPQTASSPKAAKTGPLPPALSRIALAKNQKEVQSMLVDLKKGGNISGAAAFPIANANNFYVVVIDRSETPVAILQHLDGAWIDTASGTSVNLDKFKYCTAYWVTIP